MQSSSQQSSSQTSQVTPPGRRLPGIAALYNRNFRFLWLAAVCASMVQRMDGVVLGWLVLEMTHSAFLVGLITAVRRLGALLGPWAGVVADRVDRRRLAILAIFMMSLVVAALTLLIVLRRLEVWHLFTASVVSGIAWAFFQPTQESLQGDILQPGELANGIAMSNMAMNLTTIVGPILGGLLLACCRPERQVWDWSEADMVIALNWSTYAEGRMYATTSQGQVMQSPDQGINWQPAPFTLPSTTTSELELGGAAVGVQWTYIVLLLLHVIQMLGYVLIHPVARTRRSGTQSIWQNLAEGLRYSAQEPGLWTPLVLAGLVNFATFPLQLNLLPVFAREVFSVGATGLGGLGAAMGVGAVLGSVLMINLGSMQRAGVLMMLGTFLWSLLMLLFALMTSYVAALIFLVLTGIAQAICLTSMAIMLLSTSSQEMRGRVMGLRSLAIAPLFFGGMLSGALAEHLGAPVTTMLCAAVGMVVTLLVAPWIPWRGKAR